MLSATEFRERTVAADCFESASALLSPILQELGFGRFISGYVQGPAQDPSGRWRKYKYHHVNFPAGWQEGWDQHVAHCPYYHHACFDGSAIFDWALVRKHRHMNAQEKRALCYLTDFDLVRGLTVPVHFPRYFGFITVFDESSERGWSRHVEMTAHSLLFFSHLYHEAVRRLSSGSEHKITVRERECLGWAAAGKTTEDIATILWTLPGDRSRLLQTCDAEAGCVQSYSGSCACLHGQRFLRIGQQQTNHCDPRMRALPNARRLSIQLVFRRTR